MGNRVVLLASTTLLLSLLSACGPADEGVEVEADAALAAGARTRIAGKRFTVFYQYSPEALATYADPKSGLPLSPDHVHVFSLSTPSGLPEARPAERIHAARADFRYAPAFDLHDYAGWMTANDAQLAAWAHTFRDAAIAVGADLFAFNEFPSDTGGNARARAQFASMLRHLSEPDQNGVVLRGVAFFTEQAANPSNWTSSDPAFWRAVNESCDAVVAEHYHGQEYVCGQTEEAFAAHLFALHEWLIKSNDPHKVQIANRKFTVLHSARYSPGSSAWAGADSDVVPLADFQRMLSRAVHTTRNNPGGENRISFAPVQSPTITSPSVNPRIAELVRWHYDQDGSAAERECVAGAVVNCRCH